MKKNGFIATSLIYSFFLVFIAVMAAILSSYIANKTILDRFNEAVMDDLNTGTHYVKVYSTNAQIKDGKNFTNLLQNVHSIGGQYWEKTSNSIKQVINSGITQNNKYYIAVNFRQGTVQNSTYLLANTGTRLTIPANYYGFSSIIVQATSNNNTFVIGEGIPGNNYSNIIENVMLINLTQSFSAGTEPQKEWVDENIEFFEGTESFIKKTDIKHGGEVSVTFMPNNANANVTGRCKDAKNNNSVGVPVDKNTKTLTLKNITSDLICYVDWR